ncbi:MAG: DNA primase [Puniceicoccales bacterium]|jgi:DNA primase|nr:DNA primase [Puniceicoccales bacterium]
MPRITRSSIDEVRNRADIVALIGDYTTLKKAGSSWRGLSPFTNEKTPSFYVHPHKGFFYCFSTAQGGDIFRFLMLKEGLTFHEAVERVANRFNTPLQYEEGPGAPTREERSLRAQLLAMHDHVATLYANAFQASTDEARNVRDYWQDKRKFTLETASQFQIGYAPRDGGDLARTLLKAGFGKDALVKSGLFTGTNYSPDPLRWHHKFYGRLMVPIRDIQGRTVAFTARHLPFVEYGERDPTRESKYINSPETEIFHKSQILFNLDKARTSLTHDDNTPLTLVEGQLDAIRLATHGAPATIASQGTSIGPDHLALISRYTRHLNLLLDADRAGQDAILRLLPLAMRAGIEVRILQVPGGKDPDEYLASTPDGWPNIAATTTPAIAHTIRTLLPAGQAHSTNQKLNALQTLFGIISENPSAIFRHDALSEVARLSGANPVALNRDYTAYEARRRQRIHPTAVAPEGQTDGIDTPKEEQRLNTDEEILLSLLLNHPDIAHPIAQVLSPEWVSENSPAGRLLNRAAAEILENLWEGPHSAMPLAETNEEKNLIAKLIAAPTSTHDAPDAAPAPPPTLPTQTAAKHFALKAGPTPTETANHCLASLHKKYVKEKTNRLTAAIALLPLDDLQTYTRLQKEKKDLKNQLRTPPSLPFS